MYTCKCYRCDTEGDSLTELVSHTMVFHEDLCIKYRERVHDKGTGKCGYRTKMLQDLYPNALKLKNKNITVRDGILFVTNINDDVTQIRTPVKTKGFQATRQKSPSFSVVIANNMRKNYKK